jgi:hypothetical protein
MKKLLVAVLALTTMSAFAGNSMVKMNGCFDNGQCENLNLQSWSDDADKKTEVTNIAFNYAMSFAGNWGAGLTYISNSKKLDGDAATVGDVTNTIGLSGYWNKDGSWDNSCFAAVHYDMVTNDDTATKDSGDKTTVITLEYGHRFMLGTVAGINFNWAPSVTYAMSTKVANGDDDDYKTTNLSLNMANVAATF